MDEIIITEDGSPTLYSPAYNQTYHSRHGAVNESRHVFLEGCHIPRRAAARRTTRVLEIGWGTGLNFWLTARVFLDHNTHLEYWALEKDWPEAALLSQLNLGALCGVPGPYHAFLAWRQKQERHTCAPARFESVNLKLNVFWREAGQVSWPGHYFDAVYLDAFSPDVNPELWTTDYMGQLARAMKPGAILATYSARRTVREALKQAGLRVEKRPGPRGKREVLRAFKP